MALEWIPLRFLVNASLCVAALCPQLVGDQQLGLNVVCDSHDDPNSQLHA
ncbi:MAG: hypothetical protein K2X77_18640 [Candidatus Obscuribacterales bacterium]|jgi:hypothetical protein|nr:hypothetical protein [Candidatus Obscuribacterales bacterium]